MQLAEISSPTKRVRPHDHEDDVSFETDSCLSSKEVNEPEKDTFTESVSCSENSIIMNPENARRSRKRSEDYDLSIPSTPSSPLCQRSLNSPLNCTAVRTVTRSRVRDPVVRGAVTFLHSISQVEQILAVAKNPQANSDAARVHDALLVRPGETVLFLLHHSQDSLNEVTNAHTEKLSMMRIFAIDLAALPAHEYTMWAEQRVREEQKNFANKTISAGIVETASTSTDAPATEEKEDLEEEATLLPPAPLLSNTPKNFDTNNFSQQLQIASDCITQRLTKLLQVDSVLNRRLRIDAKGDVVPEDQEEQRESMQLPAMIVWRAPRASTEEYPPNPPENWADTNAEQPVPFCERASNHGATLVVKNVQYVDALHSLSLLRPVYTLEHMYRTFAATLSATGRPLQPKSRTLIYLGASWCPPCMRLVHELPAMMQEDIPANVECMVKADMDLATPIFSFFKVEVIPVLMLLDNDVLFPDRLSKEEPEKVDVADIKKRLEKAEVERIQNSNRQLLKVFIEKNCKSLTFDEDF